MNPFHHQSAYTMIIYTHPVADNLPVKTLVAKRLQILNHTVQCTKQNECPYAVQIKAERWRSRNISKIPLIPL